VNLKKRIETYRALCIEIRNKMREDLLKTK